MVRAYSGSKCSSFQMMCHVGFVLLLFDLAVLHVVQGGYPDWYLPCNSSAIEYPQWKGPPNRAVYNALGESRINKDIGDKSSRLSWDSVNKKALIIGNVKEDDSGVYFCYDGNGFVEGHYVFLSAIAEVIQEGDNVTLSCDSISTEYPKWKGPPNFVAYNLFGYSQIQDGIGEKSNRLGWDPVNNRSLIVHNVKKSDSGLYYCHDGYHRTDKHNISVIVIPKKPEISKKEILDDGTEVIRGIMDELFKLTCTSTGGFPKPYLELFRDNNQTQPLSSKETYEIDADGNYIVTQTYTFKPSRKDNRALYVCQSSFDLPQKFYQTDDVKLFINRKVKPKRPEISNKTILDDGTDVIRVTMDELLKLTCTSTGGYPKPKLELFRDNKKTQRLSASETYDIDADGNYIVTQTYTFTPSRQDDGALYVCQSFLGSPRKFYQKDEVKLFLNLQPMSLSIKTNFVVEGISGKAAHCSASQYRPNTAVVWLQIDDDNITSLPDITHTQNVTTRTFTIVALFNLILTRDNNGQRVSCLLAHDTLHTPQIASDTIQVYYAPDVTVTTTNVTVFDTAAELLCNPSGLPSTYTYSDWRHSWPGHGSISHNETLGNNQTLILTSLTYEHSGVYHCSASNGISNSLNPNAGYGSTLLQVGTFPIILTSSPITTFASTKTGTSVSIHFYSNRQNNTVECSRNSTMFKCEWFLANVDISLPVFDSVVQTKGSTAKVLLMIQDSNDVGTFTVTISNDVGASTIDVNVLNPDQTSNGAILFGIIGGVVVVIACIVNLCVVEKMRFTAYARRNTPIDRDNIQSPETANLTSDIALERIHGQFYKIESGIYDEIEEITEYANESETLCTVPEIEPQHGEYYNIESSVYGELEERKENIQEYEALLTGCEAMISNDNVHENLETKK